MCVCVCVDGCTCVQSRNRDDIRSLAALHSLAKVGDYKYDLSAGRAAGVHTIHVATGPESWPELTDLRVDKLEELLEHLRQPRE